MDSCTTNESPPAKPTCDERPTSNSSAELPQISGWVWRGTIPGSPRIGPNDVDRDLVAFVSRAMELSKAPDVVGHTWVRADVGADRTVICSYRRNDDQIFDRLTLSGRRPFPTFGRDSSDGSPNPFDHLQNYLQVFDFVFLGGDRAVRTVVVPIPRESFLRACLEEAGQASSSKSGNHAP